MTPSARLASAIEILGQLETSRRPVALVLKEWGQSHRFAGSKDRTAIASLVFDALRVKSSASWIMGADDVRSIALGMLVHLRGLDVEAIDALCSGERHAAERISDAERARLVAPNLEGAPANVLGDYPQWLAPHMEAAFGERAAEEGRALAARAPVDLRANLLKTTRDKALSELAHLGAKPTPFSPWGLRIAIGEDGRAPALNAEPASAKGLVEVQDEASQLAALIAGAGGATQVLDLCAGAGGKTLALSAMLHNRGQIHATDNDGRRLMPIYDRLFRAGSHNVQVHAPRGQQDILAGLERHCDLVLVDAPCTGSGTWRRNPDAKWRVRPGALEERLAEQREVLERATRYVRPGGRLAYVTCSLFREENEDQVASFLEANSNYLPLDAAHLAREAGVPQLGTHASGLGAGLRLSPASTQTDGFYIAVLTKTG
jgi:16S rRNA (cytosine967-C5)-methyltransferase